MTETETETDAVPAEVQDFLADRHPDTLELALWVRAAVLAAEPELTERVYRGWNGIGFRHPAAGYICAIYPRNGEVRLLFEHGASLGADDLLSGRGRQTRYLPVREPADETAARIAELVPLGVAERMSRG